MMFVTKTITTTITDELKRNVRRGVPRSWDGVVAGRSARQCGTARRPQRCRNVRGVYKHRAALARALTPDFEYYRSAAAVFTFPPPPAADAQLLPPASGVAFVLRRRRRLTKQPWPHTTCVYVCVVPPPP